MISAVRNRDTVVVVISVREAANLMSVLTDVHDAEQRTAVRAALYDTVVAINGQLASHEKENWKIDKR